MGSLKEFILTHEPFKPAHMGNWIRERYFEHYLKRYVQTALVGDILDGGCGGGHYARKVARLFPDARILAVDIEASPEWQKDRPAHVEFRALDLTQYAEAGSRDFIYSVDVLEHIKGNSAVIKKFFAALRPGGLLYLAMPCEDAEHYYFPKKWFGQFSLWAEHEHVGEMRKLPELERLLREIGFEVMLSRHTFTLFGHLAWEMEILLHNRLWGKKINILLMPLYKLLGWLDILLPIGSGNNLIIARRPLA